MADFWEGRYSGLMDMGQDLAMAQDLGQDLAMAQDLDRDLAMAQDLDRDLVMEQDLEDILTGNRRKENSSSQGAVFFLHSLKGSVHIAKDG